MLKVKIVLLSGAIILGTTSCGIFKKDCNCPHFGKMKSVQPTMPGKV